MKTSSLHPRWFWILILFTAALPAVWQLQAAEQQPPAGFTLLFNGKDLTGWHGMPHFDPYKLAAMPEAERKAQIEKWTADAKKHWTVENGELVNDGNGAYLTTDKDYGDIELLIEYKTVPKADSGIYLRATPQVQIWDYTKEGGKWNLGADKGSGGLWNNSPGTPGKDPLVLADKPFGEWNSFRILMVGERVTVYLNDKLVVDHARLENFWNQEAAVAASRVRSSCRRTAARSAGATSSSARSPPPRPTRSFASTAAAGFVDVFNGKDFTGWAGPDRSVRGQGRRHRLPAEEGRHHLHQGRVRRFRRPRRVQAAAGRQQRPGHPLPRQGRHGLRRHVRDPGAGRHRPAVRQARPAPVQRLGLRHDGRPTAATCGRSANGTSRK